MVVVISAKREKHGVLRGEAGVGEDDRRGGGWVERGEGLLLCEEVRWSGEERGGVSSERRYTVDLCLLHLLLLLVHVVVVSICATSSARRQGSVRRPPECARYRRTGNSELKDLTDYASAPARSLGWWWAVVH